MRKILFTIILLLFSVNSYAENTSKEDDYIYPVNSMYKQAVQNTIQAAIQEQGEVHTALNEILASRWADNQLVFDAINNNKQAINLFKQAALQESNQAMFTQRPKEITFDMPMSSCSKEMLLFKLVLAEGLMFESKEEYPKAIENYIAAIRFIMHCSREEFKTLVSQLMERAYFNKAYNCLCNTISNDKFNNKYHQELLKYLNLIYQEQDFFESAFKTELLVSKSLVRMIGKEHSKQAGVNRINKIFFKKKADNFIKSVYREYDLLTDDYFKEAIQCAKKNELTLLENRKLQEEEFRKPFNILKLGLKKFIVERKSIMRIKAEIIADILAAIAQPDISNIITYYHIFYNKLNLCRTVLAVKLYKSAKGSLPDSLALLVPEYLEEIPMDTYNDFKPLSYIKTENTAKIYSIGPDRKDDSGAIEFKEEDLSKGGDILISVE
ncbi:MAG: hypothetical protein V1747_07750 [Candidatus Omnitrophota bacterium]